MSEAEGIAQTAQALRSCCARAHRQTGLHNGPLRRNALRERESEVGDGAAHCPQAPGADALVFSRAVTFAGCDFLLPSPATRGQRAAAREGGGEQPRRRARQHAGAGGRVAGSAQGRERQRQLVRPRLLRADPARGRGCAQPSSRAPQPARGCHECPGIEPPPRRRRLPAEPNPSTRPWRESVRPSKAESPQSNPFKPMGRPRFGWRGRLLDPSPKALGP